MNKKLLGSILLIFFVAGCVTIQKAIVDEIVLPNGSKGYSVDCGMYGWSGCFVEAGNKCVNGYLIHERTLAENIETKIPVDEMKKIQQGIAAVPIRSEHESGKYLIISCK